VKNVRRPVTEKSELIDFPVFCSKIGVFKKTAEKLLPDPSRNEVSKYIPVNSLK
jgi:hypothetical protein